MLSKRLLPSARTHLPIPTRTTARLISTTPSPRESQKQTSTTARHPPDSKLAVNDPNPKPVIPPTTGSNAAHPSPNALPSGSGGSQDAYLTEMANPEQARQMQAPNRAQPWSRSQMPRERAMMGPRFEQTMMEYQPRPMSAMDLIHKQPVRWTDESMVSCDGGGGPLGHPRIFINTDKPQVNFCTYCGLPFAQKQHRKYLESLPATPYPLDPPNDPAVVEEPMRVTDEPFAQR